LSYTPTTEVVAAALSLNAHTYRLLIVKEPDSAWRHTEVFAAPTKRFVCQQQRDEIMGHFTFCINFFLNRFTKNSQTI
ncbi:hypothetical protein, partial [Glaciimonas immobilis]